MSNHGTALSAGLRAEFLGTGTKALALIADKLDPKTANYWSRNSEGMQEAFLNALATLPKTPPTISLFKKTSLGEVQGKKTSDCMVDKSRWYYRDSDVDQWLPKEQPAFPVGIVSVYEFKKEMAFREMAAAVLGLGSGTSTELLGKALKENGLTLTLPALEQLVERQEDGEETGLRTDGWANFAFVENVDGSVSVARVGRYGRGWCVSVNRLGDGRRWGVEDRLLLRNSALAAL